MNKTWDKAHNWETDWWGNCVNTINEELKQTTYAKCLGLKRAPNAKTPYRYEAEHKRIMDIGSGPVSILLKTEGYDKGYAVDPIDMPSWVRERYKAAGVEFIQSKGEDIDWGNVEVDEVWMYNVLQHTEDPEKIIKDALANTKILRICEWVETAINEGHPHSFTKKWFDDVLGGSGKEIQLAENSCYGKAYLGVFKGGKYED